MQGTDYFFELALDLRLLVAFQITSSIPTAKTNALKVNATTKRKNRVLFLPTPTTPSPPGRAVTSFKSETVGCVKKLVGCVFLFFFFWPKRGWHSVCGPNACLFRHCRRPNPENQLFKTWISRLCVLISNAQRRRLNVVWTLRHSKGQKHFGKNVQDCMLLWFAADTPTVRPPVNHREQQQPAHGCGRRASWRAARSAPLFARAAERAASPSAWKEREINVFLSLTVCSRRFGRGAGGSEDWEWSLPGRGWLPGPEFPGTPCPHLPGVRDRESAWTCAGPRDDAPPSSRRRTPKPRSLHHRPYKSG